MSDVQLKLEGSHLLTGNDTFLVEGRRVQIRHRKEATEKKPPLFLNAYDPYLYVSSLYPTPTAGEFRFDFGGQLYELVMEPEVGAVVIKKAG